MLKLNFDRRSRVSHRLGDIYDGYYFPCVLYGRVQCFVNDIKLLLHEYIRETVRQSQSVYRPGTFGVFASVFSHLQFSYLLSCFELECSDDVFDILIGTIFNLCHHIEIPSDEIGILLCELVDSCPNRDLANHRRTEREEHANDDHVEDGWIDGHYHLYSTASDSIGHNEEKRILFVQCFLVYLLFSLSASQYIDIPGYSSTLRNEKRKPINMSLESLRLFIAIVEATRRCQMCPEIAPIMKRLIGQVSSFATSNDENHAAATPQHHAVRVCLFDGPQYYYQDRYGNPIPFGNEKVLINCVKENLVKENEFLEACHGINETFGRLQRVIQQIDVLKESIRVIGNEQETEKKTRELSDYANRLVDKIYSWRSIIVDECPKSLLASSDDHSVLFDVVLSSPSELLSQAGANEPESLQERLAKLQASGGKGCHGKKRTRRKVVTHRNPSGLVASNAVKTAGRVRLQKSRRTSATPITGKWTTMNDDDDPHKGLIAVRIHGDARCELNQPCDDRGSDVAEPDSEEEMDEDTSSAWLAVDTDNRQTSVEEDLSGEPGDGGGTEFDDEELLRALLEDEGDRRPRADERRSNGRLAASTDDWSDLEGGSVDLEEELLRFEQSSSIDHLEDLGSDLANDRPETHPRKHVDARNKRKKSTTVKGLPGEFINPFDLEFAALLMSDEETNEKANDARSSDGRQKQKRRKQNSGSIAGPNDRMDADWSVQRVAKQKKGPKPKKDAAAPIQEKRRSRQPRAKREPKAKKEPKPKQQRKKKESVSTSRGRANSRNTPTDELSTSKETRGVQMVEALSAQVLHPSTDTIMREEAQPDDETRDDCSTAGGQYGGGRDTRSSSSLIDIDLLRELDDAIGDTETLFN